MHHTGVKKHRLSDVSVCPINGLVTARSALRPQAGQTAVGGNNCALARIQTAMLGSDCSPQPLTHVLPCPANHLAQLASAPIGLPTNGVLDANQLKQLFVDAIAHHAVLLVGNA